jgi:hypothetical protein
VVTAGERLNTLAMNTPSGPGSLPRAAQHGAEAQAAGHGPSETRLGGKRQRRLVYSSGVSREHTNVMPFSMPDNITTDQLQQLAATQPGVVHQRLPPATTTPTTAPMTSSSSRSRSSHLRLLWRSASSSSSSSCCR